VFLLEADVGAMCCQQQSRIQHPCCKIDSSTALLDPIAQPALSLRPHAYHSGLVTSAIGPSRNVALCLRRGHRQPQTAGPACV